MMKSLLRLLAFVLSVAPGAALATIDWSAQVAALEAAAERGDAKALTELAVKYEHAEGVPKDFQKANKL